MISEERLKSLITEAVTEAFRDIGLHAEDGDDKRALRDDFAWLRRVRKANEKVVNAGITAAALVIVGAILTALWLGFKAKVFGS